MMKKPSLLLVFTALLALCGLPLPSAFAQANASLQMVLGNPDGASATIPDPNAPPAAREKFLIQRSQYAMSFNDTLHFPNWVAWHLSSEDLGSAPRGNNFAPDPDLPMGFTRITTSDYTNTGYDRGHNCPSADRTKTPQDNAFTFYMTNITPQTHDMNGGPWQDLEEFCQTLVGGSRELLIYCGHGFTSSQRTFIGPRNIPVPDFAWKIVVVLPKSTNANTTDLLSRVTMRTRVIAVRMPNTTGIIRNHWEQYITTVSAIESETGLTFFTNVPTKTAATLKTKVDAGP